MHQTLTGSAALHATAQELQTKHERVVALLDAERGDAMLLRRASSFAWASGGSSSAINLAADLGEGALLLTRDGGRYLLANEIEAPRLEQETQLVSLGWEPVRYPWHEGGGFERVLGGLVGSGTLLADAGLPGARDCSWPVAMLRARLLPVEQDRMRALGEACAVAMDEAVRSVAPGSTEHAVAARLAQECLVRGIEPIVTLVAADERASHYRHPRPTGAQVERSAMVVLCGRKYGLVASVTRLVHFGPLPDDLARRHEAVMSVDAALLAASTPGATLGECFAAAQAAYAEHGFADEWTRHHQGGLAGYEPREAVATPGNDVRLEAGHALAWNPSIAGVKCEDTVLLGSDDGALEVLTEIPGWPLREAGDAPGRPRILES